MPRREADVVEWKNRRAYRLSNGRVELTVLTGGGHIADFRLCGSPINCSVGSAVANHRAADILPARTRRNLRRCARWEVSLRLHRARSGARILRHALCRPGRARDAFARRGRQFRVGNRSHRTATKATNATIDVSLALEVELPVFRLHFRREISLRPEALVVSITEVVTNPSDHEAEFQWVEHATFGEPLFTNSEASLFLSGTRGLTWPLGYEGHELLLNAAEYQWPHAPSADGGQIDLSQAFVRDGTGFVAAVLADRDRENAFVVVHNRRHGLVAGYSYDPARFPWIALWEENRARGYAPWHGRTRARGVEFGTSPMPLGLDQARATRSLFDTPVLTSIAEIENKDAL